MPPKFAQPVLSARIRPGGMGAGQDVEWERWGREEVFPVTGCTVGGD